MLNLEGYVRKRTPLTLGGKEFTFSELTLGDMAQFRARVVANKEAAREKRRERIIKDAQALGGIDATDILERLDKPPTDDEVEAEAETVEGVIFLATLSLKYHHPEITEEQVASIIGVGDTEKVVQAMLPPVGEKKTRPATASPGPQQ